jgi:hypothetical protein
MGFGSLGERPKFELARMTQDRSRTSVTGLKELDKALVKFEKKVGKKVMRTAMTKTLAMFRKEVRRRTPVGPTRNLRKSVTTEKKFLSRSKFLFGRVFFGQSKGKKGFHAHWIEWGTQEREVKDKWGLKAKGIRKRARRMPVGKITRTNNTTDAFAAKKALGIRKFRVELIKAIQAVKAVN